MKANTALQKITKAIRHLFVGEAYTATLFLSGYGTFTCTIQAPNRQRALEEAEAMADPGIVLSCDLVV